MRIAICDDVTADRRAIAAALGEYLKACGVSATVREFARPAKLLAAVRSEPFDLYLLDVLLDDDLTGIDLARRLREGATSLSPRTPGQIPVIFFSTSREYAVDAFAVEAISYLQKPWSKASFAHVLDLAMDHCLGRQKALLTFRTGSGVVRFAASGIESVETARTVNYITVSRTDGEGVTLRGSVRSFAEQCQSQVRLVPAGRSILVNPAQVASLDKSSVCFFSGRRLTVPHSACAAISKEILALSAPSSSRIR